MKKLSKIAEVYNNKELKGMAIEQQERWLRAKIVMQFVFLREKLGYTQQEIADKMGVMRQQITRFENISNSPTIFFLVKYANALNTELDVILNGVKLIEVASVVIYNANYENLDHGTINGTINGTIKENEKIVYTLMKENPKITVTEIIEKTNIPRRTINRIITSLKEKELIKRSGANKGSYWKVSE